MTTEANLAYTRIKEKIITLDLAPGAVLHDARLMDELGIGRTPIREALKLLESEKLVVTVPRRGIFVSNVCITDLQQISEVRLEVEGLSTRLAAERATQEEVVDMLACCEAHLRSHDLQLPKERIALDRRMHRLLTAASHNKFLQAEIERFYDLSLRLWYLALERVQPQLIDVGSHLEIVEAVAARDAGRAESLMREHIRGFQETVKRAM